MRTRDLIHAEVDKVKEENLPEFYRVVKGYAVTQAERTGDLMERLLKIRIEGPEATGPETSMPTSTRDAILLEIGNALARVHRAADARMSWMPHTRYSSDEIAERGQALYDRVIRDKLDVSARGKFLALDIETGGTSRRR